jgi:hypothetical protein
MKVLMKTPSRCPFCSGPLRHDYVPAAPKVEYLNLVCDKKVGHSIIIRPCYSNNEYVDWISIPMDPHRQILWHMGIASLVLNTDRGQNFYLPFFEPNLTNYRKLIDKIKTYILFS